MSYLIESLVRRPAQTAGAGFAAELASFLVIGGSAALGFTMLSTVLVSNVPGIPAWMLNTLCYAAFIVPVYLLHRRFSFRSDAAHAKALPRYVAVQVCGLGLAALFSAIVYGRLGLSPLVAAGLVIGLTSGTNFAALRLWAFAQAPTR